MTGFLHDFRARVIILVDSMPETHKAEIVVLILGTTDVFRNSLDAADFTEHLQCGLVGATMGWPPEARDAGGDAGEWIGAGRTCKANRRSRGVLLVVRVEDENAVH